MSKKEAHLWHCHFGHLNHDGLRMLSQKNLVVGLHSLKSTKEVCTICLTGKQHKIYAKEEFVESYKATLVSALRHMCLSHQPHTVIKGISLFLLMILLVKDGYISYMKNQKPLLPSRTSKLVWKKRLEHS